VFIHDSAISISVVGTERADASYPMRGCSTPASSPRRRPNAPVCDANPFPNIYTMLTRKTGKATVSEGRRR